MGAPEFDSPQRSVQEIDIELTWQDRESLRRAMASVFPTEAEAHYVLLALNVPAGRTPSWAGQLAEDWWLQFCQLLDRGIIRQPYRQLLQVALDRYAANPVFVDLADRYLAPPSPPPPEQAVACHVIVRAYTEEERLAATYTLHELRLDPQENWSTAHAMSFAVNSADVEAVRRTLERARLGWTLVPPGQPDYLLRDLFVTGADGSRFRITDAPATQTVRSVITDVVEQYEFADTSVAPRPAVADIIAPSGERRRLDMEATLHEAGVRDGDTLRVGQEGLAGAAHPALREAALSRAAREIHDFIAVRPGVAVRGYGPDEPPIEYEMVFTCPSFGPPGRDTGIPTLVDRHVVRIQLGADYPLFAPAVFWLSPIFHPNVFPVYPSQATQRAPDARGLVCLGQVADAWTPATGLAHICQTIIDIAAYRNYNITEIDTGDADSRSGDYFDYVAAAWAARHGELIRARCGRWSNRPNAGTARGSSLLIERVDGSAPVPRGRPRD